MTQVIDGLGQIGLKVYANIAALPAPRLGAVVLVDGGTGGQPYFAVHNAGGVLVWAQLGGAAPTNVVVTNPTAGQNIIAPANGVQGLEVDAVNAVALSVSSNGSAPFVASQAQAAGAAILQLQRLGLNVGYDVLTVDPGSGTFQTTINPQGEITARKYSTTLPTADASHEGGIIYVRGTGIFGADTAYVCLKTSSGYQWYQIAPGVGAANAQFRAKPTDSSTMQISTDAGVTWTDLITAPTGATGAQGSTGNTGLTGAIGAAGANGANGVVQFPPLPDTTHAVDLNVIIPALGFVLPWQLPTGYTMQVKNVLGMWKSQNASLQGFISDANGCPGNVISGFNRNTLIYVDYTVDANGNQTAQGLANKYSTFYTAPGQRAIGLGANVLGNENAIGYLTADVVIGGSSYVWSHTDNFNLTRGTIPFSIFPNDAASLAATGNSTPVIFGGGHLTTPIGVYIPPFAGYQYRCGGLGCVAPDDGFAVVLSMYLDLGAAYTLTHVQFTKLLDDSPTTTLAKILVSNDLSTAGTTVVTTALAAGQSVIGGNVSGGPWRYVVIFVYALDCTAYHAMSALDFTIQGTGMNPY